MRRYAVLLSMIALPAFVAVWSGWVGLGAMTGFGPVALLPGIADITINTAITLPLGAEVFAVLAAGVWLDPTAPARARHLAHRLLWISAGYGAAGQVAYHLMRAAGWQAAPWPVTVFVSVLPVGIIVLGLTLVHLIVHGEPEPPVTVTSAHQMITREDAEDGPLSGPPLYVPLEPWTPQDVPSPDPALDHGCEAHDGPATDSFPDGPAWPSTGADRREIVEAVAAFLRSGGDVSDRVIGSHYGRSRNWGRLVKRDAAARAVV